VWRALVDWQGGFLVAGSALGVLIGLVSGIVFLLLLKTAVGNPDRGIASLAKITGQILAIPTFWFGGPWLTGSVLKAVVLSEVINPYVVSLALVFAAISAYPAARWIIHLGEDFGKKRA